MADELQMESGIQPDAPEDLQTLESMIAADEAAEAAQQHRPTEQEGSQPRDNAGKFTAKGASASKTDSAPRAGERQTPEEISARNAGSQVGARKAGASGTQGQPTGKTQVKATGQQQQAQATDQGSTESRPTDGEGEDGKTGEREDGRSPYRKEIERRERSWAELNKQKEEFKNQQAEFELREKSIAAREQALRRPEPRLNGHTAAQYEAAAPKFEANALDLERRGEFEQADEQRLLAKNARQAAAELKAKHPESGDGGDAWQQLKADLPDALVPGSPLNTELRALVAIRGDLLAGPAGPYRVALLAGRKLVAGLEQQLQAKSAEAGLVPGLRAQVDELSARVKELEGLTSPGGDDGGGAANRGNAGEPDFASMTTEQQERWLDRHALAGL